MCLLNVPVSSWRNLFISPMPIFNWVIYFFFNELHIFWIQTSSKVGLQIFSLFNFLMMSFEAQKSKNFDSIPFFACGFHLIAKKITI